MYIEFRLILTHYLLQSIVVEYSYMHPTDSF